MARSAGSSKASMRSVLALSNRLCSSRAAAARDLLRANRACGLGKEQAEAPKARTSIAVITTS